MSPSTSQKQKAMTGHEYAQKCLDTDGYLVLGTDIRHSNGAVINVDNAGFKNTFTDLHAVVVGEASHQESVDQCKRLCDEPQLWRRRYYYKVIAE